jgi:hypothetical protein
MAKASEWGQAPRHLDFVRRSSMFAHTNTNNSSSSAYTSGAATGTSVTVGAGSSNDDSSRFYSSAFAHPNGESQSSGNSSVQTANLSSNVSSSLSANLSSNVPQRAKGVLPPTPLTTHTYRVSGGVSPGCRGSPLQQQPLGNDNGNSGNNSSVQQQQYDTHEAARKQVLDAMRIVRLYPAPLTCSAAYQVRQLYYI